jgi:succinate dehydrogenase/fumarate reductase cytochrome b subunit
MSAIARGETEAETVSARGFWQRRIFSFCGVVPLGVYVVWHLLNNIYAVQGAKAFDARLAQATSSPVYRPAIWLFVYVPFAIHAVIGLLITLRSKPNPLRQPRLRKRPVARGHHVGTLRRPERPAARGVALDPLRCRPAAALARSGLRPAKVTLPPRSDRACFLLSGRDRMPTFLRIEDRREVRPVRSAPEAYRW